MTVRVVLRATVRVTDRVRCREADDLLRLGVRVRVRVRVRRSLRV